MNADLKVLLRLYKPWLIVPILCISIGFALHMLDNSHPAFIAVFVIVPLISLFERMFSRTEYEAINYQIVPSAGKVLVVAKNASSLAVFYGVSLPAVIGMTILFRCGQRYTVQVAQQLLVIGLFMLLAGNIVAVRVVDRHINGLSMRNSMIMGFSISMAVILCQALSAFLGSWISVAICVAIFCVMYPFSSRETASSLQEATVGFLEVA